MGRLAVFNNPHPWRIMTLVFGGVLVFSFGIQKLFSPLGDLWIRAVDAHQATVVGVVTETSLAATESQSDKTVPYALDDGVTVYRLGNPAAVAPFAGRWVRVSGILHQTAGVLDVKTITAIPDPAAPAEPQLDRSTGAP